MAKPKPLPPWINKIIGYSEKPANQFLAHELNARRHPGIQREPLRGSLDSLGWVAPVVESARTGKLLDGHARIEEALTRGEGMLVPVVTVDLTEEEEKLFLAVYDPITGLAEYDSDVLRELLDGLAPSNKALQELLEDLGARWGVDAIADGRPEPGAGGDEFDATPEDGPTRSNDGDLWLIGERHRVFCGDASSAKAVGLACGGQALGLCVTSPPYYNQRRYAEWQDYESFRGFLRQTLQVMLQNVGDPFVVFWNMGDAQEDHVPMMADSTMLIHEATGMTYLDTIVWLKNPDAAYNTKRNMHIRANSIYYPGMGWESLIVFRNGTVMPKFDAADVEYVSERTANIWPIHCATNQAESYSHPAVFPIELPIRAIRSYSTTGAVVYDPFMGSGTTLVAAHRHNRIAVGLEKSPRYMDVILRRAEAEGLSVELLSNHPLGQPAAVVGG